MTPIRIQRKRVKGWKMPENTVSVTRPGKWGNPFKVGDHVKIGKGQGIEAMGYLRCLSPKYATKDFTFIESAEQCVELYNLYLTRYPNKNISELRGKNLACFCPLDKPCHADVLLKIANE